MLLKNKKTGEIVEVITGDTFEEGGIQIRSLKKNPQIVRYYASLAELNEEWEDYEEPKEYWCISCYCEGGIANFNRLKPEAEMETFNKSISNYFETKEEAEKAVEKLKAWKRLKDKGFKFIGVGNDRYGMNDIKYRIDPPIGVEENDALHFLFGGEE